MLYHEPSMNRKMTLMISVENMNILIKLTLNTKIIEYKKN